MWYRDGEERNLPWPKRSAGTRIPCGVSSRALSRPRLPPQALEVTPALFRQAVQPYLQLVEDGARCEFTGQRLADIWRYFRFTWATAPETTPGRTLLYLVRDAARPLHPVMGLASLENAPVFIACRDDALGWTVHSFVQHAETALAQMREASARRMVPTFSTRSLTPVDSCA